jgi:DNA-binding transcriptional MerR regulator
MEVMKENKRMIGDVSKELGVPKHTIRAWENELQLDIPRDEKGYRYYGDHEMYILRKITDMKRHGMIPEEIQKEIPKNVIPFPEGQNVPSLDHKMLQFQNIMVKMMGRALNEQKEVFSREIAGGVTAQLSKELDYQFRIREEHQEQRFQKIDELIRIQQKTREEIAATREKKSWFRRKKS